MLRKILPGLVLACGVLAALLVLRARPEVEVRSLRSQLVAAATTRPHAPRVTDSRHYLPIDSPRRGDGSSVGGSPELRIIAARIESLARDTLSPEAIGLAGTARLLIGQEAEAIQALEIAVLERGDSRTLNDLAAAYLSRSENGGESDDLVRALEASARATADRGAPPEAWFNRGLVCERAALTTAARHAWAEYLRRDPMSAWADEARAHLRNLTARRATPDLARLAAVQTSMEAEALVGASPQRVREWFESTGAREWGEAVLRGRAIAASELAGRLRLLGDAHRRRTGDDMLWLASLELEHPTVDLARGSVTYAEGLQSNLQGSSAVSRARFEEAAAAFTRAHSVRRLWADVQLALLDYQDRDLAESERRLTAAAATARTRPWPLVGARADWLLGIIAMQRGSMSEAVDRYGAAARAYESAGEYENAANVFNTTADTLRRLGDRRTGWQHLRRALASVETLRDPIRRYLIFFNASLFASRDRLTLASLDFQNAALEAAMEDTSTAGAQVEARLRKTAVLGRLHRDADAAAELAVARRLNASLTALAQRQYFQATADMVEGELRPADAHALDRLDAALAFFRKAEPAEVPGLLFARARAEETQGRGAAAEAALLAAIDAFVARRHRLGGEDDRVAYLGEGVDLFTELVRVRRSLGRGDDAVLDAVEQGRSRTLFEDVAGRFAEVRPVSQLLAMIPDRVSVVVFAVMGDGLSIWVVDRHQVRRLDVPVTSARVDVSVDLLDAALRLRAPAAVRDRVAQDVAEFAVQPWLPLVPAGNQVVLVLDGALHRVPFALLPARERQALVSVHALSVAPSVNLLLTGLQRANSPRAAGVPLLVGNPQPTERAGSLRPLPDAASEVRRIAAIYTESRVLLEGAATRDALIAALPSASVLHFAGHAVVNAAAPRLSHLVLAGDEATGRLHARDIAALNLSGLRVVVLAACQSTGGSIREGEGMMSLARPFLAAGVRVVVGSLWDISDAAAAAAFVRLHERLREGMSAGEALRDVQTWMMQSEDPALRDPVSWAGLTVVGVGIK